jgi:hypothetical protein
MQVRVGFLTPYTLLGTVSARAAASEPAVGLRHRGHEITTIDVLHRLAAPELWEGGDCWWRRGSLSR